MRAMPGTVAATGTPRWRKFSVSESDFTAAATSEDIELFQLGAGELIHAVKIKHSASFTGGLLSAFFLSVGIAGDLSKYAGAFNVFQAAANDTFQVTDSFSSENHGAATSIRVEATSVDDDVVDATAGAAEIWVLVSKAT